MGVGNHFQKIMKIYFFKGSFNGQHPIILGSGISIGRRVHWVEGGFCRGVVIAVGLVFFGVRVGFGRFES